MNRTVNAIHFDGASSEPRPVTVHVSQNGLAIQAADGIGFIWPARDIARVDGPAYAGLRLACASRPDERLTVQDPDTAALLTAMLPALKRAGSNRAERRRAFKWIGGGLVGLAALGVLAFEGLPRALAALPMSWAAPIGDNVRGQIVDIFGGETCKADDPGDAKAILARLARRLLDGVEGSRAFDPALVDVSLAQIDVPNALAAPGGRIVVFTGIFDLLDDGPEIGGDALAGVIAHEIAHTRLRHPTAAIGRSLGTSLLASLLGGGYGADAGALFAEFAYTRDAERDADTLAREMLLQAGIGDAGLKRFFERIGAKFGDDDGMSFLSTHPASAERAAAGPGLAGPKRALTADEWRTLREDPCAE